MEYKIKHTLTTGTPAHVLCAAFSPNGRRVASGCSDGRLSIWSVDDGANLWNCKGFGALLSIQWVSVPGTGPPPREMLLCGYSDGTLVVANVSTDALDLSTYRVLDSPVECLAFRGHTISYIVTGGCHEVSLWNEKSQSIQQVCSLPPPKPSVGTAEKKIMVTSLHWLNEDLLASFLFHGIIIFDVPSRSQRRILQIPSVIVSASISPDLMHLVVHDSHDGFAMYELKDGELLKRFDSKDEGRNLGALSSNFIHGGKALATGCTNGSVQLWDVEENYVFSSLEHGPDAIVKSVESYYIPTSDVFLLVTGVSYPPSRAGIYVWQTIKDIDEQGSTVQMNTFVKGPSSWWLLIAYIISFGLVVFLSYPFVYT